MNRPAPSAILFDLDDTILVHGIPDDPLREMCELFAPRAEGLGPEELFDAIVEARDWYWSDPRRHRIGLLDLEAAGVDFVSRALSRLGIRSPSLARDLARAYTAMREKVVRPFPGAIEALQRIKASNVRTALVTNGASGPQRGKIERYGLGPLFDYILIEGEFGAGKPERQVYLHALEQLRVVPSETWMVGDNLEWEVAAPQRLGIFGVWVDWAGAGLPESSNVRPDWIIRSLAELL